MDYTCLCPLPLYGLSEHAPHYEIMSKIKSNDVFRAGLQTVPKQLQRCYRSCFRLNTYKELSRDRCYEAACN